MRPKKPLTLTSLGSLLFLIANIVARPILVGADIVCPQLCTCRLSAHSQVIECNGKNLTAMPYLSDTDTAHTESVFDLYINRNRFGYIIRHSFYSFAGRLRILEIMENEGNIEIANAAFEPFRESLKVLRIGPLSGNLNEQLFLFSPLTSLVKLTIGSCGDDGGGVLFEPFFGEDSRPHLEVLDIHHCRLSAIKNITFRQLKLKVLNLSNNKFTEIPPAVTSLIATSLTHLYMANNSLGLLKHSYLPHNCKLTALDLSFNRLTSIKANTLDKCSHLQILNLSHNPGLTSIGPDVFRGLSNLTLDLDYTSIAHLNFIQPDQLLALRIAGSKIPCTCELQNSIRRSFRYRIRGTCVNIDDLTVAGVKDLDISYLDMDCHNDTRKESVHREVDPDVEDFSNDAELCTSHTGMSRSRGCSQLYHQSTSTDGGGLFPEAPTSNLDPKEAAINELAPANSADAVYIDYFNPLVAASLLFSIDLTKPQKKTIISSQLQDTLPTHSSNDASVLHQNIAFTLVQPSAPFLTEAERTEQSLPPSVQLQQVDKELTTQLTPVELTHLQETSAKTSQPNKESLYSPSLRAASETSSAPLSPCVSQDCTLDSIFVLSPSPFVSPPHILSQTEEVESPSESLQPSQALTISGLSKSCGTSGSWSGLVSRETTAISRQLSEDQVTTVTPSLTYLESTVVSSWRQHPVEDRNPGSRSPVWSSIGQTPPLLQIEETSNSGSQVRSAVIPLQVGSDSLPQQIGSSSLLHQGLTALPQQIGSSSLIHQGLTTLQQQAESTVLPHAESTVLLQQGGSTALPQQAESTVLPQQAEPTVLPQQAEPTVLPQQAESTVLPQQAESTVLPQQAESTVLPQQAESTVLPQQAESTALPQQGGSTALPQQAESTVLPQQAESTVLPQQAESTALPQQAESTALPQQGGSTALPQHIEPTTLPPPGKKLVAALGVYSLEEASTTDTPERLGDQNRLSESVKASTLEQSDTTIKQSTEDVPALMSHTSKLLCSAGDPQQFQLVRRATTEPLQMIPPSDAMPLPHASSVRRGRGHTRYNRINTSTNYQRCVWRNVESSTRISLKSTREYSEGSQLHARLWILRCPICMLACFIHGCLTFAAFLTLEHGGSK